MRLRDYLDQSDPKISIGEFAAKIGVNYETVRRYLADERRPDWDVLKEIVRVTGGAVTPDDFLCQSDKPKAPPAPGARAEEPAV